MLQLSEIRDGLARGEFFLEYQPIVSLADGRCLGAEALVRWRRGDHVVPPSEFIPLVDNTPVSGFITYWVMEAVTAELGAWLKENPDVYVTINAPPEILGRGGIEYAAVKSGLMSLSSQVMLEITERGIPDLLGVASINDRGGTGVRIALDDVTLAGAVSMAVLMRCQFDAIKLDKSLVDQITPDPRPDWMNAYGARRSGRNARDCRGRRHGIPGRMPVPPTSTRRGFIARPLDAASFVSSGAKPNDPTFCHVPALRACGSAAATARLKNAGEHGRQAVRLAMLDVNVSRLMSCRKPTSLDAGGWACPFNCAQGLTRSLRHAWFLPDVWGALSQGGDVDGSSEHLINATSGHDPVAVPRQEPDFVVCSPWKT